MEERGFPTNPMGKVVFAPRDRSEMQSIKRSELKPKRNQSAAQLLASAERSAKAWQDKLEAERKYGPKPERRRRR
jgi:hypothetical protein